jgi:hypothetical protein
MEVMIIEGADNLERYEGELWNCGENIFLYCGLACGEMEVYYHP